MKYKVKRKLFQLLMFGFICLQGVTAYAETINYNYDDLGRLVGVHKEGIQFILYQYDEVGNRLSIDLPPYSLVISSSGIGSGSIAADPPGIPCGNISNCYIYDTPTLVTLTATYEDGSGFTGWEGGGCTGTGDCVIFVDGHNRVASQFHKTNTLTVRKNGTGSGTVISSPPGIDCGADCSGVYEQGTVVTMTAVPDPNSYFTGWPVVFCMADGFVWTCELDLNRNVSATFILKNYALTVTKDGTGTGNVTSSPAGINCGADCSENFDHGTEVTLTVTPDINSIFTGWSGGGCSGTADCIFSFDSNENVIAQFAECSTSAVRIAGVSPVYYNSLQAAYDVAADGDVIETTSVNLIENPTFNRDISINIEGGYNCNFSDVIGKTVVAGNIALSVGKVNISNYLLE